MSGFWKFMLGDMLEFSNIIIFRVPKNRYAKILMVNFIIYYYITISILITFFLKSLTLISEDKNK